MFAVEVRKHPDEAGTLVAVEFWTSLLPAYAAHALDMSDEAKHEPACARAVGAWASENVKGWTLPSNASVKAIQRELIAQSLISVSTLGEGHGPFLDAAQQARSAGAAGLKYQHRFRDALRAVHELLIDPAFDPSQLGMPPADRPSDRPEFWAAFWAGAAVFLAQSRGAEVPRWAVLTRPLATDWFPIFDGRTTNEEVDEIERQTDPAWAKQRIFFIPPWKSEADLDNS
jgi:hypothetical protein